MPAELDVFTRVMKGVMEGDFEELEKSLEKHKAIFGYHKRNPDRRWWQFWKPRFTFIPPTVNEFEIVRGGQPIKVWK